MSRGHADECCDHRDGEDVSLGEGGYLYWKVGENERYNGKIDRRTRGMGHLTPKI